MKKRALILAMITFIAAATSEPSINMVRAEETQTEENTAQTSELPIKTLTQKVIDENPYMAASDSNIHHDCYNTDSTDEVLPVDIYSEINVSYEKVNPNASPAVFFDSYGHAVVPLLGGLAIRDINAEETQTLGYFSPKQHDNGEYLIQSSYSFVDESNRLVCPTNNNHVLMLKATDEDGNVLPEFEKVLDIDIKAAAEAALGKTLDQNLLALDMKTGEVVASLPVIDELPEGSQVSVENSAIVYDNGAGTVSTIVCNWFGAGSANLGKEDSDSSIQSYTNIYDENWLKQGNKMITPGVERVDTIKTEDGYEMKSILCRSDLSDTSMLKLSTATGYIYGYVQNLETGMWQYIILDFETGETVFSMDVASKPMYNNMAIGMYAGNSGNSLYCPTGYLELLRLQDRFVYLPEMPYRKVDLDQAMRNVLSQEKFAADGGLGDVEGWLNTITIENVHPNTTVAIRMKGISGETGSLKLYAYGTDGTLKEVPAEKWHIQTEDGETPDTLSEDVLYEVHMTVEDGGDFDLSETEKEIKISAVLGI